MRNTLTQKQADMADDISYGFQIYCAMREQKVTNRRMAEVLGMTPATFRARLADPATITRGEARQIARFLGLEEGQ